MKKRYILKGLVYPIICIALWFLGGCSGNGNSDEPKKKAKLSLEANGGTDFYDMLEDYPGMESLFTAGDMSKSEFEDILFDDFLGETENVDAMVFVKDSFPVLINQGTYTSSIFSEEIEAEMESKGPIPDFIGMFSEFTEAILDLRSDQKDAIFAYLDELVKIDPNDEDQRRLFDYLADLLYDFIGYLNTIEENELNNVMYDLIVEFSRFKVVEDGKLDFVDLDEVIAKFTGQSPDGMVELFEGLKGLADDPDFKPIFAKIFSALGDVLKDPESFPIIKDIFTKGYNRYNKETLGEIFDRVWAKGPIIGPEMEKMGIEGFGKDGKIPFALKELLNYPEILSVTMEVLYHFQKEGFGFEETDDAVRRMMTRNPFCFPLDGEGELGNGNFYEPNDHFSYKEFTGFEGLFALFARWNVPFTFTCPFLHEGGRSAWTKWVFRTFVPKVNEFPCSNFIWSEIWEKDPNSYMGNGHPIENHEGLYGRINDDKFIAPMAPGLISPMDLALYLFGDSLINGPYDNIYDNFKWVLYERDIYMVIDFAQFFHYLLPPIGEVLHQACHLVFGMQSIPITIGKFHGGVEMINWELTGFFQHIPHVITGGEIPQFVQMPKFLARMFDNFLFTLFLPLGHNTEGSKYLMSKDIRDMATIVYSSCYYDEKAFHLDRWQNEGNPKEYARFYDVSGYTYEKNPEEANPFFNVSGALCVIAVKLYEEAVKGIPKDIDYWEDRQAAAKAKTGMVFATGYILNMISPFTEVATEKSLYDLKREDVLPILQYIEPLLLKDRGVVENFFNLLAVMGRPENKVHREKLLNGISKISKTIDEDTKALYTFANELLRLTETAVEDMERWDSFKTFIQGLGELFNKDSEYSLISDFVDFVDYMIRVDMTDEDFTNGAEAVVQVLSQTTSQRIYTRGLIHLTTLFDEFDKFHNWKDTAYMMENAVNPDGGLLAYVFKGLDKDPEVPWIEVIQDTDRFLQSEIMQSYDDGSFWKDIYHLLDFLAEAVEAPAE